MIRKLVIAFPLYLLLNSLCFSQERKDIGIQAGGNYYVGDYNMGTPLYQPSPGFGIIYRYNLNKYYSFRLSACYGSLKGSYSSIKQYLPNDKFGRAPSTFSKRMIEADGLCEINFMSFTTKHLKNDNFSPYVLLGFGAAYISGDIIPHMPFGIGVKYCPVSRVTIGAEWKLSKTFNDRIDNYQNVNDGSNAILHNNDWFSFIGLFVTFRLHNYNNTCPVYQ